MKNQNPRLPSRQRSSEAFTASATILCSLALLGLAASLIALWVIVIAIFAAIHPVLGWSVLAGPYMVMAWVRRKELKQRMRSRRRTALNPQ